MTASQIIGLALLNPQEATRRMAAPATTGVLVAIQELVVGSEAGCAGVHG